jgi:cell division protein FtsB
MTDTLERPLDRRSSEPRRRRRWASVAFVVLLVALGLVATGVLPVQQYLERETQVDAARTRLEDLVAENAALADEATALLGDEEIERIAREQYGFVKPGEIGYVVITPDTPAGEAPPAEPVADEPDRRGMLQRVWDFVTGRDVSADG